MQVCPFDEAKKGKFSKFTDISSKKFVAQSVFSTCFPHFEKRLREKLVKVTHETEFGCELLMKRFCTVCNQSAGTRKKNAIDLCFKKLGYRYITDQNRQCDTGTFNTRKPRQIDELHDKLR